MDFIMCIKEGFTGSLLSVVSIAKIVIPLMIAIEILKEYKILDVLCDLLSPISKILGISKNAVLPLVVGLILGLAYGAGVIIKTVEEGDISRKDLYLLMIFLIACHSVFEDTLLFVAIGANGWLLIGVRFVIAVIITIIASRFIKDDYLIKSSE